MYGPAIRIGNFRRKFYSKICFENELSFKKTNNKKNNKKNPKKMEALKFYYTRKKISLYLNKHNFSKPIS